MPMGELEVPQLHLAFGVYFSQYHRFKDLVERAPAHVENPTGQLLRRWDDGHSTVELDDDYECDDEVVDDDNEEKAVMQIDLSHRQKHSYPFMGIQIFLKPWAQIQMTIYF
ncbi:hypothetical protein EV424DRAFT_1532061 [Suillus variegatus]|nr:hypothetical protein EV424DRAFT_1532061 [Suillus variegatus]